MTTLLDVDADVLTYMLYGFGLSFADVVAFTGTCKSLRCVGRREFLGQYRFLKLRMQFMGPDERDNLTLISATHILLRWHLTRLLPVFRLRNPKKNLLRGCVLAMAQFGVPTQGRAFSREECVERANKFAGNRALVFKVFGFVSGAIEKAPGWRHFDKPPLKVYRDMINRLSNEDVDYFVSVAWHCYCPHFWERYQTRCMTLTPDKIDVPRIIAQGHQRVLHRVVPDKTRKYADPRTSKLLVTEFSSRAGRYKIYNAGDVGALDVVTNIDLIRLMVIELHNLKLMPEYVEKHKDKLKVKRTYAEIARDGKSAYLAGEPVDNTTLFNALLQK